MVEFFLSKYSKINRLTLIIGMALEGISLENHKRYSDLMNKYSNVQIYYKVKMPLTHIKLYEFLFEDSKRSFVGSANFSEAGLFNNEELLVESKSSYTSLFDEVLKKSLICTDNNIRKYIKLYEEVSEEIPLISQSVDSRVDFNNTTYPSNIQRSTVKNNSLVRSYKAARDAEFRIPIIYKDDSLAYRKGINAWVKKQDAYLEQSTNYIFSRHFPLDREFKVITEKNEMFTGTINSWTNNRLLLEPDIYTYLCARLGIKIGKPLSYEDLDNYGATEIWGEKIEEGIYFFDFSPRNNH